MAQVLTANRLIDGAVLYWKGGVWVEALAEAEVFTAPDAAAVALTAAEASLAGNVVVAPYLFEVRDGRPVKTREAVRAAGPSVRPDLGKQADEHRPPPALLRQRLRRATSPQGGGDEANDVSL
jgi:hypothetical protein